MKSDRFMELSDWERNRIACPAAENGDFRAAQGKIDIHFTATFRTFDSQQAAGGAELVCDDPLASLALDSDFHYFLMGDGTIHIHAAPFRFFASSTSRFRSNRPSCSMR